MTCAIAAIISAIRSTKPRLKCSKGRVRLVRDAVCREMLHALDQTTQSIAKRLANDPALAEFHGHYHNFLRQWAEP
ncbi:hypothetical protein [Sphingomonas natans]|uniref:hypothetical protein n=1 Tax=Sphingomonas natans TaxID=3063330 RepID=UPI003D669477